MSGDYLGGEDAFDKVLEKLCSTIEEKNDLRNKRDELQDLVNSQRQVIITGDARERQLADLRRKVEDAEPRLRELHDAADLFRSEVSHLLVATEEKDRRAIETSVVIGMSERLRAALAATNNDCGIPF